MSLCGRKFEDIFLEEGVMKNRSRHISFNWLLYLMTTMLVNPDSVFSENGSKILLFSSFSSRI
jgi:hypothetical protein